MARVIYGGRTFLRRIIDAINTLKGPYHRKRMTETMRKDILLWADFMEHFNGKTFFVSNEPTSVAKFSTNASLVGDGAHYQQDWFYVNWELDFPHFQDCHINQLKLSTVLLALRRWGTQLSDKWIVNCTDNAVTKSWLNKWGGTGGRETGRKGGGRCTGGGRSGIPKVAESGRKRGKIRNIAQYFAIEKMQRGGSQKIQGGNWDYRVREAGGSNPPVPPPLTKELVNQND